MKLTFLNADVALTKSYTKLADGTIQKSSYPNVWEVSSVIEDCKDLTAMLALINKHAALNNCLLKGEVTRPLIKESRKDSTDRNAATHWLCLDIDGIELLLHTITRTVLTSKTGAETIVETPITIPTSVDSILMDMGLGDISYILQWSGSQGISSPAIRCHVFMLLTKPVSAPLIKQWLIQKNHEVPVLAAHQALTKTGNSLTWGLDVTACQSDKLIYIAPPVLKGIKNPLGKTPRISLVKKSRDTYDITGLINSTAQNRALTDTRVLELRDLAGLPKRKLTYKTVGAFEVLSKPDECIATEIKQDRGFVYFNLNGGDSWAYYHPEDRPDYIFNFKGEPTYLTKELLPSYWEQLKSTACRTSSSGTTYLAFLDKQTSTYWRGTYDAAVDDLDIYPAKTETMLRHFADANGMPLGDFIPEWDMEFNPHDNVRVDFNNRTINTFQLTEYMRAPVRKVIKCPPMIFRIIDHILKHDAEAIEHFMNWLSFIAQERTRTRTAWVFQGIPGTGKGLLINRILRPLFGDAQTAVKRAGELSEKWTDFVAGKFIVFIDEIQSSALKDEAGVIANLKNFITEPTATIRMMNKNAFDVPNHTNWIFASNKPDPVSVDKDDRRFNVGPYQGNKFMPTDAELALIPKELQDFHHFLMSYPVNKDQACSVLDNDARNDLIELSQTTSESAASAIKEGTFSFFLDQLPSSDAYKTNLMALNKVEDYRKVLHDILLRSKPIYPCNISRDELFTLFNFTVGGINASPTTFSRFLGHRQITVKPVQINSKTVRGVPVFWTDIASFPAYLDEHFPQPKPVKYVKARP